MTLAVVPVLAVIVLFVGRAQFGGGFDTRFESLKIGMTAPQVRRVPGPPLETERQPSWAVYTARAQQLRRPRTANLFKTLDTWYYGGNPDDPKSDLDVVDFLQGRFLASQHAGPGQ